MRAPAADVRGVDHDRAGYRADASGETKEGAAAFLERRVPAFGRTGPA